MATIKDIAKKLNISTSTVSYALNGGPRPVPDEVRERVLKTAKELDYRPNRLARMLITGRSHTIGVVPTNPYPFLAITPYFQGCFNGIVNEAEALGKDVLLFTRYDQTEPDKMADTLLDGRVDGLVFLAPVKGSPIFEQIQQKIPYVVLSGESHGGPLFGVDNFGGAKQVVEHLTSLGHQDIAIVVGLPNMDDAVERHQGFLEAMSERNLPVRPEWVVQGEFSRRSGYQAAEALLNLTPRPTAVFCSNDEMAHGFLEACRDQAVRVPEELSLVGFDDAALSAVISPSLTTVRQPWDDLGAAATRSLISLIEGEGAIASKQFSTQLIVRASTTSP